MAQFSNFKIDKKAEGGFVAWDANTDIAKMNYYISGYDEKLNQSIVDSSYFFPLCPCQLIDLVPRVLFRCPLFLKRFLL